MSRVSVSVCAAVLLVPAAVQAATIHVPGDAATITAAVARAANGDTIAVAAGSYTESVPLPGRQLTFLGAGADVCIWTAAAGNEYAATLTGGAAVTVRDFTVQGGVSASFGCSNSDLTVERCILQNNGRVGLGIGNDSSVIHTLAARDCLFRNNPPGFTDLSHGGIRIDNPNSRGVFERNLILGDKNPACRGIFCLDYSQSTVRDNVVVGARYGLVAGTWGARVTATGNVFIDCPEAIWADREARLNAGDLSNAATDDDGGNVFFPSNTHLFTNDGAQSLTAEGSLFPRLDAAYLSARTTGTVDRSPSFELLIDRVMTTSNPVDIPWGQWWELRLVSDGSPTQAVDIGGWMLSDDPSFTNEHGLFTIPEGTQLRAGESIAMTFSSPEVLETHFLAPGAQLIDLVGEHLPLLNPDGDELFLTPNAREVMDCAVWGAVNDAVGAPHWSGARLAVTAPGHVYGRVNSADTNVPGDWDLSLTEGRALLAIRHGLQLR